MRETVITIPVIYCFINDHRGSEYFLRALRTWVYQLLRGNNVYKYVTTCLIQAFTLPRLPQVLSQRFFSKVHKTVLLIIMHDFEFKCAFSINNTSLARVFRLNNADF